MKFLRPITFASLVLLCVACQPVDPLKDITISIDLNIFKTFVSFRFVDARTGGLIGINDNQAVTLRVSGSDAQAVVLQTGERPDVFTSVAGMISAALNPYAPFDIHPGNPVTFSFEASTPGYETTRSSITLEETGTHTCMVVMRPVGQTGSDARTFTVIPGEMNNGILPEGFRLITPDQAFELVFPDSLELLTAEGDAASGLLTIRATTYTRLDQAGIGATGIMLFQGSGTAAPGSFEPQSILSIEMRTADGKRLTQLPDQPVTWRFPVSSGLTQEESVPVWVFNPDTRIWGSVGEATLSVADTLPVYSIDLNHFSLFAAGVVGQTREIAGSLSFSYTRPFLTAGFQATLTLVKADGSVALQILSVPVSEEQPAAVTLQVPIGETATLVLDGSGDYEFSCDPAIVHIQSEQESLTQHFTLRPLKCRFSGTISGSDVSGEMEFPTPAVIRVLNSNNGSAYQSIPVTVTGSGFEQPLSLMVYENYPVDLTVVPSDLMHDFYTDPGFVHIETPCQENGSWAVNLISNTCPVVSTVEIALEENSLPEPVQVDLAIRRASDRRLITRQRVSLASQSTDVPLTFSVPRNTPVVLELTSPFNDRPVTVIPEEFIWEAPCVMGPGSSFRVSPGYAYLRASLGFTFDPALTFDEVPLMIQVYRSANDEKLFDEHYTVTRSGNQFDLSRYVPSEPLVLKVTRANPDIRFNPVPFKVDIPDPSLLLSPFSFLLKPTELVPVHFLVKVVCPGGEVFPTVQGYYRIPGQNWKEMNIISGHLNLTIEMGLTYEVGMILGGVMIDSVFTVTQQENDMTFPLDASDCEKMGWK